MGPAATAATQKHGKACQQYIEKKCSFKIHLGIFSILAHKKAFIVYVLPDLAKAHGTSY